MIPVEKQRVNEGKVRVSLQNYLDGSINLEGYNPHGAKIPFTDIEGISNEPIGTGGQGAVYKVYTPTIGTCAMKVLINPMPIPTLEEIEKALETQRVTEGIELYYAYLKGQIREIHYTSEVDNHPNILRFYGYVEKDSMIFGILTEYMAGGSLAEVIRTEKATPVRMFMWALQLARALAYCHEVHGVVHRDIKLDNCLLDKTCEVLKLCDFGLARAPAASGMTTGAGTLNYMAPEVIWDDNYNIKADVWSYGMLLWAMTHKQLPFGTISNAGHFRGRLDRGERPPIQKDLQVDYMLLIVMEQCWARKPEDRPIMRNIVTLLDSHFKEVYQPPLGQGSQGTVYKAYHPAFGCVAFKRFTGANKLRYALNQETNNTPAVTLQGMLSSRTVLKNENRELLYSSQLDNHPNILKFLAYVDETTKNNGKVPAGMLLELVEQALGEPGVLNIDRVKLWSVQLARALHYCHDIHKVVHRDVKVENALLCDNYNTLKLCDFGFTREVDRGKMTTQARTICCAAPETIDSNDYGFPCDVYSYGMFIYTVLHKIHKDDEEDIFRPEIKWDELVERFFHPVCQEQCLVDLEILRWLMKACWRNDQDKRPTMKEIVDLLTFHFQSPLSIVFTKNDHNKHDVELENISHYSVAFKVRNPDQVDGHLTYTIRKSSGILKPHERVNLEFEQKDRVDIRFLIEYVKYHKNNENSSRTEESQISDEDLDSQLRKMEVDEINAIFSEISSDKKAGKQPGKVGLTTLGWPKTFSLPIEVQAQQEFARHVPTISEDPLNIS